MSTAFKQSLPVLITSLVNKSGSIGLSLLPILLIEGNYTSHESSLAMSFIKGATIAGTLLSGWFGDVIGLRKTVLISFAMATLGLAFLPLSWGISLFILAGVFSQLGITSINSSMRMLLVKTVDRHFQKEAIGWIRFVNNLGQILSFGLASLTATLGAKVLIWFDSLTSLLALVFGFKLLPNPSILKVDGPKIKKNEEGGWWIFIGCTLFIMAWNFMYEFFAVGLAGKIKVIYPDQGLKYFSLMMVANTVVCASLAVFAARVLKRVVLSLVFGVLLTGAGLILGIIESHSLPIFFLSVLLISLGEVIYGALGQFLLIRSVPKSNRENMVYSIGILFANLGKISAAGLAFPLFIYRDPANQHGVYIVLASCLVSLMILVMGYKKLTELSKG